MKTRIPHLLCILILSMAWGCFDDGGSTVESDTGVDADTGGDATTESDTDVDDTEPAAIEFPEDTFVIEEDDPTQPTADVYDGRGEQIEDATISWESADTDIIEISGGGFAVGQQPGHTELIAHTGDIEAVWPAQVVPTLVAEVTVVPSQAQLLVDQSISYSAVLEDSAGIPIDDDRSVHWSTTDGEVATIDDEGIASGLSDGTVDVVATVEGVEGRGELTVTDADVERVEITPGHPTGISVGQQLQLEATAYDIEDTKLLGHTPEWSSSDSSIAEVDGEGLVVGVDEGEATVTASIDGVEDSVDVEVTFQIQSVSSGNGFSCAIATHRLFCWGRNDDGQLGDGSQIAHSEAVPAQLAEEVEQLSVGHSHGCVVDADDEVWCWGNNDYGQLGQPIGGSESTPKPLESDHSFRELSAGHRHTCGITDDDQVYCWGDNDSGQLGSGGDATAEPTAVGSVPSALGVAAGDRHTCMIADDNSVYCWGANDRNQLGGGTDQSQSSSAVEIIGGNEFGFISAGADFTCGIDPSGPPACWGANERGQLGADVSTDDDHAAPRSLALEPGQSLSSISAGDLHACGIVPGEGPHCWGAFDDERLGTVDSDDATSPQPIDSNDDFPQIDVGAAHVCGRTPDHRLVCWGDSPADGADPTEVPF